MRIQRLFPFVLLAGSVFLGAGPHAAGLRADDAATQKQMLSALNQVLAVIAPVAGEVPRTFTTKVKLVSAKGLPQEVIGHEVDMAFQAPDRLRLSTVVGGDTYSAGRDKTQMWMHASGKKFGLIGSPEVPRFRSEPGTLDGTKLPPLKLPLGRELLFLAPILCTTEALPDEEVAGERCDVLRVTPRKEAAGQKIKLPAFVVKIWARERDSFPVRIAYDDRKSVDVVVELRDPKLETAWAAERWKLEATDGDKIETVALGHLTRFVPAAWRACSARRRYSVRRKERSVCLRGPGKAGLRSATARRCFS